jgi:hypothetical protein
MRATFQNTANTLSITLIFTVITIGLAQHLPAALFQGLSQAGIPAQVARAVSNLPPTAAMFAAFLGYNPMATLLPAQVTSALPAASRAALLGQQFFPNLISGPFRDGLVVAFSISAALSVIAALVSLLRGARVLYQPEEPTQGQPGEQPQTGAAEPLRGRKTRQGYD